MDKEASNKTHGKSAFLGRYRGPKNATSCHSLPLAATSCRLIAKPLFNADTGFTLQAKRIINNKSKIKNERSDYLERKVRGNGRQA